MKITLRDPIGQSLELDSSPSDIERISAIAESHVISPTEVHFYSTEKGVVLVDDVLAVLSDYVLSSRNSS